MGETSKPQKAPHRSRRRNMKRASLLITLIIAAAAMWLLFDNPPFASEIMVYQGWCSTPISDAKACRGNEESANPVTYKALSDNQTVIYWFEGRAPDRLTNCAVRDAKNWSCGQGEGFSTTMIEGRISETSKFGVIFYQVPKYRWYWLWLHTNSF